jgi:hypothetical protein
MADIHNRAVIATARVAIDQEITASLGSHMAQSHGCEFSNVETKHACQFALRCLISLVGAPGFEPGTPSPPDWCANRAALRSANGSRLNCRRSARKGALTDRRRP